MRVRTARSRRPARLVVVFAQPGPGASQGLKNGRTYQVTATQSDGSGNTGSGHEPVHDLDEAGALVGEAELHEANRRERAEAGRSTNAERADDATCTECERPMGETGRWYSDGTGELVP